MPQGQTGWSPASLQFPTPNRAQCSTLTNATLRLRTEPPLPMSPVALTAYRIRDPWTAGVSGAAHCQACEVFTGEQNTFALPNFTAPIGPYTPNVACSYVSMDITSMVQAWCSGVANHGLLLTGASAPSSSYVSFHSMEAPAGTRPELTITY